MCNQADADSNVERSHKDSMFITSPIPLYPRFAGSRQIGLDWNRIREEYRKRATPEECAEPEKKPVMPEKKRTSPRRSRTKT